MGEGIKAVNMAGKYARKGTVLKLAVAVVLMFFVLQPATAIVINNVVVKPAKNGVVVGVNYTLDPISAIRVFIFGAKAIEKDIISLFNTNENFKTLRIGYNYAEFVFPANVTGNLIYFKGINLSEEVNVTVCGGTPVNLGKTDKIPPIYFCMSVENV